MPHGHGGGAGETFVRRDLGAGMTLHVLTTTKFKTVTLRAVFRRTLSAEEVALNALIPFVLRRGSARYPDALAIERHLEHLYGAQLDVDSLKIGETQVLDFALEVAADRYVSPRSPLVWEALAFLGDVLLRPLEERGGFRPSFVAQEADVLRRRIEGLINDKPRYALERLRQTMCADEPFGLHRYGTPEALSRVDPVALYAHYRRVLRESPVDVFVVGDVDVDRVEGWVREALPIPRGTVMPIPPPENRVPGALKEVQEEEEVHQGIVAIGYRTPVRYPDDAYPQLLMYNGILGAYPHSKLFMNVRERASLAYFAGSRLDATKGIIIAYAGIDPAKYQQARDIMERQAADIAAGRISDEEMNATRKALIHGLRSAADSAGSLIDHQLLDVVNGCRRGLEATVRALEAVTREQVVEVAGRVAADTVYFLTRPSAGAGRTAAGTAGGEEGQ